MDSEWGSALISDPSETHFLQTETSPADKHSRRCFAFFAQQPQQFISLQSISKKFLKHMRSSLPFPDFPAG